MKRIVAVIPVSIAALVLSCATPKPVREVTKTIEDLGESMLQEPQYIDLQEQDVIYFESSYNGGTTTVFPHKKHAKDLRVHCNTCHHQDLEGEKPRKCTQCHDRKVIVEKAPTFEVSVHTRCIDCHKQMNAEDPRLNTAIECAQCHIQDTSRQDKVEDAARRQKSE